MEEKAKMIFLMVLTQGHGTPWPAKGIASHGPSRVVMLGHGRQWCTRSNRGGHVLPGVAMVGSGWQWLCTAGHDSPWPAIVGHRRPWPKPACWLSEKGTDGEAADGPVGARTSSAMAAGPFRDLKRPKTENNPKMAGGMGPWPGTFRCEPVEHKKYTTDPMVLQREGNLFPTHSSTICRWRFIAALRGQDSWRGGVWIQTAGG